MIEVRKTEMGGTPHKSSSIVQSNPSSLNHMGKGHYSSDQYFILFFLLSV